MLKRNGSHIQNNGIPSNSHLQDEVPALIRMRGVQKFYFTGAGEFPALKGIDLNIYPGEFVSIVGKSGSGKTTLINMIAGIDRPTAGEVWVGDTPVHRLSEGQMAVWRGRNLGIVFQFFQLLPTLTVLENVLLPMDFCHRYTPRERVERTMHLLELVEIADQAHKLPSQISGGQQQRAAIARALANDPPVIVGDEPTGNLDSKTAGAVFELFEKLVEQGKTFVIVTHDPSLARRGKSGERGHRSVIIADGEVYNGQVAKAVLAESVALDPEAVNAARQELADQSLHSMVSS
jgi:putative ABC transport system ATP-binding protein